MKEYRTAKRTKIAMFWTWGILVLFPISLWFLISVAVSHGLANAVPYVLMLNHTLIFVLLVLVLRRQGLTLSDIGWHVPQGWRWLSVELITGLGAGIALGLLDRFVIGPLAEWICKVLQWSYGGIPHPPWNPSALTLAAELVASTFFAGIVEETVFRGYAITVLRQHFGVILAVAISSLFFGALHLGLGATAVVENVLDGALFACIFIWRKSLVSPAVAHATANVMGFF